jgi:hypothetical protein
MQNVKREMDGKHTHLDIEGEFLLNNKCSTSVQGALVSFLEGDKQFILKAHVKSMDNILLTAINIC